MSQTQKIYDILSDGQWHCPIEWGYGDGHTKRITDINRLLAPKGKEIIGEVCDCGRHTGPIKKRKIVSNKIVFGVTKPKPKLYNLDYK